MLRCERKEISTGLTTLIQTLMIRLIRWEATIKRMSNQLFVFDPDQLKSIHSGKTCDETSISQTWEMFYISGHCLEIRAFGFEGERAAGYFDNKEDFITCAKKLSGIAKFVFVTMNPVPIDSMALYPNIMAGTYGAIKSKLATHKIDKLVCTAAKIFYSILLCG
jgi:hypothetical protein